MRFHRVKRHTGWEVDYLVFPLTRPFSSIWSSLLSLPVHLISVLYRAGAPRGLRYADGPKLLVVQQTLLSQ